MTCRLRNWDYTQRTINMITCTLVVRSREWLEHLRKSEQEQRWFIGLTPDGTVVMETLAEMTREDAKALNRLCQWLAVTMGDAINYHGMCPEKNAELACRAARITDSD